jgi:hypothetical protein
MQRLLEPLLQPVSYQFKLVTDAVGPAEDPEESQRPLLSRSSQCLQPYFLSPSFPGCRVNCTPSRELLRDAPLVSALIERKKKVSLERRGMSEPRPAPNHHLTHSLSLSFFLTSPALPIMPRVDINPSSGPLSVHYTISTPEKQSATEINPAFPTILFLHPVFVPSEIWEGESCTRLEVLGWEKGGGEGERDERRSE